MEVKEIVKETFITWNNAVASHNSGNYNEAMEYYNKIQKLSARMWYNMACAQLKLGNKLAAIQSLTKAIEQDKYLAVAFFQRGTLYLQSNSIMESVSDLEIARALLRGNTFIDYKPLGLLIRLTSFQVKHNLALAYIKADHELNARALLLEAFDEADDVQRKSINISFEKFENGDADLKQIMNVSPDRLFAPPKYVTKNLEKPRIVRRAKVVSAANADDRNAAFEGSKRVRELKMKPTSVEEPANSLQHFIQRHSQISLNNTKFNVSQKEKGMKSSKSMGDLRTDFYADDGKGITGSSRTWLKFKRLFQKRTPDSSNSLLNSQLRKRSQCFENDIRSCQLSLFSGMKKLFSTKKKFCTCLTSCHGKIPLFVQERSQHKNMKESNSQPDILKSCEEHFHNTNKKAFMYGELNLNFKNDRHSLGSGFGNNCYCIYQTQTCSQDALTGIHSTVSPAEHYSNTCDAGTVIDSHTEQESTAIKVTHQATQTDEGICITPEMQEKQRIRKSLPPPPSYPPPPLPSTVVIFV